MAKNEQIRVDLVAEDKASDKIEDVADAAKQLERLEPEIEITADTGTAESDIEQVGDAARALSKQDTEILLRAKVDAARAELKTLEADLKQAGEQAETTRKKLDDVGGGQGPRLAGNQISDMTGPLGEASSAASDFGGVFDGLGDIAESVAGKLGASAAQAAGISSAFGGIGLAVAAGAAAWALFTERQRKAREEAEKLTKAQRELNDAIKDNDAEKAATAFKELYGPAIDNADELGVSTRNLIRYITGLSDVLPGTEVRMRSLNEAADDQAAALAGTNAEAVNTAAAYENLLFEVNDARQKYTEANGTIREQDTLLREIALGLGIVNDETAENARQTENAANQQRRLAEKIDFTSARLAEMRGELDFERAWQQFQTDFVTAMGKAQEETGLTSEDILGLKEDILEVAEFAKMNPAEVRALMEAVDRGEIDGVLRLVQNYMDTHKPVMRITPVIEQQRNLVIPPGTTGGSVTMSLPGFGAAAATTIVNMSVPRGYRGDLLADARRATRRTGRYYHRAGQ